MVSKKGLGSNIGGLSVVRTGHPSRCGAKLGKTIGRQEVRSEKCAGAPLAAEDGHVGSPWDDDPRNGNEVRHPHYSRSLADTPAGQSRIIPGWYSSP